MTLRDKERPATPIVLATLVAVFAAALVWAIAFWQPEGTSRHSGPGVINEAPSGGEFTLQSAGGPVSLKDFRGKVVLLYFGYTQCPDVCPTSLAQCAQAFSGLAPEELERIRLLFVSVDPERDTLPRLKEYAEYFHPNMVAVTGTPDQVASVASLYGSGYTRQPPRADGSYAVDHSAFVYLIDRDGKLTGAIPYGTSSDKIRARIKALL